MLIGINSLLAPTRNNSSKKQCFFASLEPVFLVRSSFTARLHGTHHPSPCSAAQRI